MSDGADLRAEFLLDPDVTFLNHGSFGACPRAVLERYQHWQVELERQPVLFLARRVRVVVAAANEHLRRRLAELERGCQTLDRVS